MEKVKKKKDQDRQKRKELRIKIKKSIDRGEGNISEEFEDLLHFKDSERESLISYFEKGTHKIKLVDTPTRLVNESNDFLN